MKTNNPKKQIIPATTFESALCKVFKCNPEDLAFEIREENKSGAVIYNQQTYVIKTHAALLEEVENMLTTPEEAQIINQSIWTEVTKGVLTKPEFYNHIIEVIDSLQEAGILNLALNLSNRAGNNEEIFWRYIEILNPLGFLLGKLVVATAKLYNFNKLCNQILDLQIQNGFTVYNYFVNGTFNKVSMQNQNDGIDTFYVYGREI